MKIKLIVMITLLIHLVCMSVAWAESEDLSEMDKQTGGGGARDAYCCLSVRYCSICRMD